MRKGLETKLRGWIKESAGRYLGLLEVLYATNRCAASYVHQGDYVFWLLTPHQITNRADELIREAGLDQSKKWEVQKALLDFMCKKMQDFLSNLREFPMSVWSKIEKDPANTVSCRTPLVEYLNPMPAYELSEEKLYQELLKFIKDEGYKTFDEFEKAISLKAKPVKLAIENSLVVSGPQIKFQEKLIQKAQELLSNVSPAEAVQEVDLASDLSP